MLTSYWKQLAVLLGCLAVTTANAQEIYKWVDASGETHYSEVPPETSLSGLEVLEVTGPAAESRPAPDYERALEVANSMQADRLERERLRLEKRKLEQLARQAELDARRYDEAYRSQAYVWPYYGYGYGHYPRPPYGKPPGYHRPPPGQGAPHGPYPGTYVPKRVYINR